ncbi:MAG TPA: AAA family ATPase [Bacillota bacterium]|nr:AAA family ATPase [Bacillota bacterium]
MVIGSTGSGKSTLAAALAKDLGCPHVELDAFHWEPDWVMAPTDLFRARVAAALAGERWVVDGNYSKARDLIWPRAEMVIWLDLPLPVTLARLWRRTWRRTLGHEALWNGNRERLATQFLSRDSLFVWAPQTHRRHRREWAAALGRPEHAHLRVVRLTSPREVAAWQSASRADEAKGNTHAP